MPESTWLLNDSTPTPLAVEFSAAAAPWTAVYWAPFLMAFDAAGGPPAITGTAVCVSAAGVSVAAGELQFIASASAISAAGAIVAAGEQAIVGTGALVSAAGAMAATGAQAFEATAVLQSAAGASSGDGVLGIAGDASLISAAGVVAATGTVTAPVQAPAGGGGGTYYPGQKTGRPGKQQRIWGRGVCAQAAGVCSGTGIVTPPVEIPVAVPQEVEVGEWTPPPAWEPEPSTWRDAPSEDEAIAFALLELV